MEYSILELLVLRQNELVRRSDIWEQLYEFDTSSDSNVIDVMFVRLRKKLKEAGMPPIIKTRRGQGYIIEQDIPAAAIQR